MRRVNRFTWSLLGLLGCHGASAPPPSPSAAPTSISASRDALTRASSDPAGVTPEWVMLQVAELEALGADDSRANDERAEAYVLAAKGEGLLIEHFTTLFWNKAEPGRRVLAYLQKAIALDPNNEDAAVAYTFALLGIRKSGFRSQAEDTMGVKTSRELAITAPLLDRHRDSLLGQSALRAALSALEDDGSFPSSLVPVRASLEQRLATLRARDAAATQRVDEEVGRYYP